MAANKEHLKLLLEFISKILEEEGNEWFHDELAILFSKKFKSEKDTGIKLSAVTIKELGSIEKYLDEGLIPIIDYSNIYDERVKFQLERDAIEMGKCRLSDFSGSISFEKFCKYAHFQSEELINFYFFKSSNGDVEKVKTDITNYSEITFEQLIKSNSISSIPHYMKLWALSNKINLLTEYNFTLGNIAKVRNLEIHRDSNTKVDEKLLRFIKTENYNQVYEALVHLKNKIAEALNYTNTPHR
ncbi:hypothetical protein CLV31_102245 [Algoriphagus aquaeductus]|uniref:Uncharacterized protein n=1 Tax=Algoriphagus aquaeductus TaxID=475299 RepID=A0A326RX25_9BACT|nr:hypothetical protein [Algoriphagus aquaeductus]PZV86345.1 hypothetical protein CLV31_102245 [Algoriphagus aquaeductus]